jgi:hypothetical protein
MAGLTAACGRHAARYRRERTGSTSRCVLSLREPEGIAVVGRLEIGGVDDSVEDAQRFAVVAALKQLQSRLGQVIAQHRTLVATRERVGELLRIVDHRRHGSGSSMTVSFSVSTWQSPSSTRTFWSTTSR